MKKLVAKIRRLFVRTNVVTPPAKMEATVEETPKPFDYGLSFLNIGLASKDYGWTDPEVLPKRFILVDIENYREKVSVRGLASAWRGTGHSEWEFLLAGIFVSELLDAYDAGEHQVDITKMFDRDFLARNDRKFSKEQVREHILPWFEVTEVEDAFYLRLKVA